MKIFYSILLVVMLPITVWASCLPVPIEKFASQLATAHQSGSIDSLDKEFVIDAPIQVFIEHSIGEEKSGEPFFVTSVANFKELAELLKTRQLENLPTPLSRALRQCANGLCRYDFNQGILHNHLYLKEFRYNDYTKCLEIESIWFLDGD